MKKMIKKNGPKAKKNDIVIHNGEKWTVLDRDYYADCEQSYYTIRSRRGRNNITKFVRSDAFAV